MTIIERLEEKVTRQESKVARETEKTSCLQRATGDSDVCDVQKASKH